MTEAVELEVGGLKCDAEGCGWKDMTIPRASYPEYINAPCPDCGSNILTEADWNLLLAMEKAAEWMNGLYRAGHVEPSGDVIAYEVEMNGTGNFSIGKAKP